MCPHILRYLTTAVITNKDVRKRRQVLKDLVKVIQQVRTEISSSFCSFSLKLYNFILMCLFWDDLHIQCWFFFFPSYWCHSLRSKMCINKFCFPSPHKTKCRKLSKMLEMVLNHSLFFFLAITTRNCFIVKILLAFQNWSVYADLCSNLYTLLKCFCSHSYEWL